MSRTHKRFFALTGDERSFNIIRLLRRCVRSRVGALEVMTRVAVWADEVDEVSES